MNQTCLVARWKWRLRLKIGGHPDCGIGETGDHLIERQARAVRSARISGTRCRRRRHRRLRASGAQPSGNANRAAGTPPGWLLG